MNDRLMIAAMVTNGLLSSGRLSSLTTNRIAADALLMADALLAAAGEQDDPALHEDCVGVDVHNVVVGRIQDERDRAIARAEAAEAKVAELEAKLAAVARLAQDSAEAAGEMVDGVIQCPWCLGSGDQPEIDGAGEPYTAACIACRGSGEIPDRRKPTANDRALERILDAVDHARAIGMTLSPEFLEDIIREEAAHD